MGFDLCYTTTEKISPALQQEMVAEANQLNMERSWVQCLGPDLWDDDGFLAGCSRLSPLDPDGSLEAQGDSKPIGRLRDLLHALCRLSGRHGIDWEISHDHGDVGFIEYGIPDERVVATFDGLEAMLEGVGDLPDGLEDMFE